VTEKLIEKKKFQAGCWWLPPVHSKLPGKLRLGGYQFKASPAKQFMRPPSQAIAGCSGTCLSSQATQEAEVKRIMVPGKPWTKKKKKAPKTPSQWKKAGNGGTCLSSQ
jgi:hypothetical protein